MLPVALLPLLVGVAWACPLGFKKHNDHLCISHVKSMSWEEGRSKCASSGGPSAVLVPIKIRSGKGLTKQMLPLWTLPKELRMETESEDECHVAPGCVFEEQSCNGFLSMKMATRTTCYELTGPNDDVPCYFRIRGNCSSLPRRRDEFQERDCFKHTHKLLAPSISLDYRNGEFLLSVLNYHLLDDCWCVMAELDRIYENNTTKATIIYEFFLNSENQYRLEFNNSKGDFEKGAVWCHCFDHWTGLMLKTDVYGTEFCNVYCANDVNSTDNPHNGREDKIRWCLQNPVCNATTTTTIATTTITTTTPSEGSDDDILESVKKLDSATTAISNLSVALRQFEEELKSVPLQEGRNFTYKEDALWALVLPKAIGVKADDSELSSVSEGVTADDLAEFTNVTAAVVFRRPQRIAFVLFKKQEAFHDGNYRINSPVVEVVAEDKDIDIVLMPIKRVPGRQCAFWDLQVGKWNTSGCSLRVQNKVNDVCRCNHLTMFAQIVFDTGMLTPEDEVALEYISVVGCAASLLGALGTIVASVLCPEWRRHKSTLMLLNLTAAVALRDALFLAAAHGGSASRTVCVGVGVALHYAELAAGAWCVVAGVLQIFRFTTLTRGSVGVSHLVLRCVLVAWPAAALPVATLLGVQGLQAYAPGDSFAPGLCFPRGAALLWAATLPLGLATLTNAGVFLFLLWVLCGFSADSRLRAARHGGPGLRTKALKCVMLCFLLGLPWLFGVPVESRVLPYVFCITATPQGLVLFLFFVISNKGLRSSCSLALRRNVIGYLGRLTSTTDTSIEMT